MDFEGLTNEFEFFHDLELGVDFNNCSSYTNTKVRHIFACVNLKFLNTNKSGSKSIGRTPKSGIARSELRSIFNHS